MNTPNTILTQGKVDMRTVIKSEGIALRHFGIDVTDDELTRQYDERAAGDGIAYHSIGQISGERGLSVSHRYENTIDDIRSAVSLGDIVMVVLDDSALSNPSTPATTEEGNSEELHDIILIVRAVHDDSISAVDASSCPVVCPVEIFSKAWHEVSNYMVVISSGTAYIPHPINTDDVLVEDDLVELREAIAENAHEVWAQSRQQEGWTYGPVRDDITKQHPDMRPYSLLPETEKDYDRQMAMHTIKLVKKLGWDITRHESPVRKKIRTIQQQSRYPEIELRAIATLALKLLCADKKIASSELIVRNKIFTNLGITSAHEQNLLTFSQAHQIYCNMAVDKRKMVKSILHELAIADGILHPEEERFIENLENV